MPPKKPAKEAKKEAPKKGAPKEPHEAVGTDRGELERLAPPADAPPLPQPLPAARLPSWRPDAVQPAAQPRIVGERQRPYRQPSTSHERSAKPFARPSRQPVAASVLVEVP